MRRSKDEAICLTLDKQNNFANILVGNDSVTVNRSPCTMDRLVGITTELVKEHCVAIAKAKLTYLILGDNACVVIGVLCMVAAIVCMQSGVLWVALVLSTERAPSTVWMGALLETAELYTTLEVAVVIESG